MGEPEPELAFVIPQMATLSAADLAGQLASGFVERVKEWVEVLQKGLGEGEELRVELMLQNGESMPVSFVGFHDPHLVAVLGSRGEHRCVVLTHMNCVQLAVSAVRPREPEEERGPIGFQTLPQPTEDAAEASRDGTGDARGAGRVPGTTIS